MDGRRVCVIIIDANAHMRRLIGTVLGSIAVTEVLEARSTAQAMPLMVAHRPHLVIMDWAHDPTDGVLFVHRLRRGEIGQAKTPVLALSASLHHAILEQAQDAGIDEVIAKPISAREMIQRAATLIEAERRRGDQTGADAAE